MRIASVAVLGSFGLAAPAAAATPERFDMICRMHSETTAANIAPIVRDTETRMSVDLGRKLWCWHMATGCEKVVSVVAADDATLKLGGTADPQADSRIAVDLASGAFTSLVHVRVGGLPEVTSWADGRCTMAPFTPGLL